MPSGICMHVYNLLTRHPVAEFLMFEITANFVYDGNSTLINGESQAYMHTTSGIANNRTIIL